MGISRYSKVFLLKHKPETPTRSSRYACYFDDKETQLKCQLMQVPYKSAGLNTPDGNFTGLQSKEWYLSARSTSDKPLVQHKVYLDKEKAGILDQWFDWVTTSQRGTRCIRKVRFTYVQ